MSKQPERCPPHYCDNQGLCHYCGIILEPSWFTLTNTPPKPAKVPLGNVGNGGVQKMLLTGLDCPSGTRSLFDVDGA